MKAVVYATTYCPYCTAAKNVLAKRNIPFDEIDLTHDPKLREEISAKAGGWKTVPMIFLDGKFIGGFDELSKLDATGMLKA